MGKQERVVARERRIAKAAAERRARKRNRVLAAIGAVVVVGLVVAIVVTLVNAAGRDGAKSGGTTLVAPAGATAKGALVLGKAEARVRLEIYLDYMCPYCGRFERANAAELDRMVADGTVRLELYPLSFLDKMSNGTRYSTRAANAVATVADRAPDRVQAFSNALFANQPGEGTDGLPDTAIANLARGAGVPAEVVGRFTEGTYQPWVEASTSAVFASGITGTPTVMINGVRYTGDLYTAGPLTRAVAAASGQ